MSQEIALVLHYYEVHLQIASIFKNSVLSYEAIQKLQQLQISGCYWKSQCSDSSLILLRPSLITKYWKLLLAVIPISFASCLSYLSIIEVQEFQ